VNPEEMKKRTKAFALTGLKLIQELPDSPVGRIIQWQLGKCSTSVGANYRAACRAKSRADFIAKLGIVEEETDESVFWLEILKDLKLGPQSLVDELLVEGNEILAIIVSSIITARSNEAIRRNQK